VECLEKKSHRGADEDRARIDTNAIRGEIGEGGGKLEFEALTCAWQGGAGATRDRGAVRRGEGSLDACPAMTDGPGARSRGSPMTMGPDSPDRPAADCL